MKKKGCFRFVLITLGSLIALGIIIQIVDPVKKAEDPVVTTEQGTPATVENVEDTTMIKYNDSLRIVEKKKIEVEMKNFNSQYDDIEQTTWVYSKTKPKYTNSLAFYTYIGLKENGNAWKRLVVRYHGNDWLFLDKIIIKTDSNVYTLEASDSKRDHNTDVWEWIDINLTSIEDVIVNDIINSKVTKIRFVGKQYSKDWLLSRNEIKGLKEIDKLYYLLNSYHVLNNN